MQEHGVVSDQSQMRRFRVAGRSFGDLETLFLVEEGQANQGDFALALRMIGLAARTGADGIEFQVANSDDFYVKSHPQHKKYQERAFTIAQLANLRSHASEQGLLISAMALTASIVPVVAELGYDIININSGDLTNPIMLDAVAAAGVPFLVGTTMATLEEIDWAVNRLRRHRVTEFALLHGQHVMATGEGETVPTDAVSLATISRLAFSYDVPVGFTDHTASTVVAGWAAAAGAVVVTKHLAPQAGWRGPDWQVCLLPEDMTQCVATVRSATRSRGGPGKILLTGEQTDRRAMRKSVVAARDLPPGKVLNPGDLVAKRPGTGMDPRNIESLIGRRLCEGISYDEELRPDHLE